MSNSLCSQRAQQVKKMQVSEWSEGKGNTGSWWKERKDPGPKTRPERTHRIQMEKANCPLDRKQDREKKAGS